MHASMVIFKGFTMLQVMNSSLKKSTMLMKSLRGAWYD
ncbi:hypothetical protein K013_4013 [Acinetobacter baumannii 25569_7]|nr:hypothetical protein K013_4013 [Acinetobacter baumannii 25569_7]CQR67910.1 hypothetical protein [Acinetobacter baumannii]CQR89232.1 hypothetical protein [Acinetobacter baumannii]